MLSAGEVKHCQGMASIPGGTFTMGCNDAQSCDPDESPEHAVTVSSFQIDKCEFTEGDFERLKRTKPELNDIQTNCDFDKPRGFWNRIKRALGLATALRTESCDLPFDSTWFEAYRICKARGEDFRLPTEAEWEYVARGPSHKDKYGTADGAEPTGKNARFNTLSGRATVGSFAPKMWGNDPVYDLAGNVSEWVGDWWSEHYTAGAVTGPTGPTDWRYKVLRGGSFYGDARSARAAYRGGGGPGGRFIGGGFRCARSSQGLPKEVM